MGEPQDIAARARRRTVPIVIVALVVGAVVGVLFTGDASALERVLSVLGFAVALGGLSGAFSLLPASFRLAPSMQRPVRDLDAADRRAVQRAVYAGRPIEPSDSTLAARAAEWARGAAASLPHARAQFLLLFAGIGGPQLPNVIRDDAWSAGFSRVFVTALVVVGIAAAISSGRNIRGTRRYLAATAER
ncbi:hypothetical protein DEI99_006670 [Curtobacterium sp. MCLR17_036]|uniref:hypothetical protein n=1 Tax=Curtobacterium sp. MCLR17_036 TaxID=2175620 RepID=UPI000DA96B2E|nr:hypothetical protein [Curtobacterium sp. MCLR17_036]WIE66211.1 hypothetical protein DEI99_006670 [Curtobacterium sp. MCLR17_036]